jgi:hypothetical protein
MKGLTMSKLMELIKALVPRFKSEEALDDAYLSESNDMFDLERRMREIDSRARSASWGLIAGHRAW